MRKILFLIFFISSFNFVALQAQYIPRKWVKVYQDSTGTTYVDTTSIRSKSKQIIFWSFKIYNDGITTKGINGLIFRVKTQYVVNDITKRFSILGVLYYDQNGKLIGDNYNSNITGAGEIFSKPINISKEFERVYNFVSNYLFSNRENQNVAQQTEKVSNDSLGETIAEFKKNSTLKIPNEASKLNKTKTPKIPAKKIVKVKATILKKEKTQNKKNGIKKSAPPITTEAVNWNVSQKETKAVTLPKLKVPSIPNPPAKKAIPSYSYNVKKERFVTSSILTDGTKYVVQVSSWKNKRIAQSQVSKLRSLGYNAFIVNVYIRKRHGTWHRVRVGYFNSLLEAKKIRAKIRKQLK